MQQELEETKPTENSNTQRDLYVSLQTTIIRFLGWLTIVSLIKTTTQKMFPEKSFLVTMFSFIVKASLELLAVLQSLAHDCWGSLHTPLGLYHTKCNKRRQKVKKKKKATSKATSLLLVWSSKIHTLCPSRRSGAHLVHEKLSELDPFGSQ